MKDSGAKENVRTIVERDLHPVRPLWPPSKRALALMPLALAIVVGVPVINYFRPDFDTLGFFRGWGLSLLESCAGLAIPLVVLRATADNFNLGPKSWSEWRYGMACFRTSVLAATPILAASAFLTRRAFALRPVAAGILWGLGCGLIADAGLRLYCEFTSMPHVMLEHFGAVVASMLLGAIVSSAIAPPSRPKDESRARRQP